MAPSGTSRARFRNSTVRAAHSGERYLANSMSPGMMKMIFRMKAFRMSATAFSYAGPLDFVVTGVLHGDQRACLRRQHDARAGIQRTGPDLPRRVVLGSSCTWIRTWTRSWAHRIADDIRTILESATC